MSHGFVTDKLPSVSNGTIVYTNKKDAQCYNRGVKFKGDARPGQTLWINETGFAQEAIGGHSGSLHVKSVQTQSANPLGFPQVATAT